MIAEVGSGSANRVWDVRILAQKTDGITLLLDAKPIEIAAPPPFGQVAIGDRDRGKILDDERLHFREGVDPVEESLAAFAFFQAEVDLVADGVGQPSDFSSATHNNGED